MSDEAVRAVEIGGEPLWKERARRDRGLFDQITATIGEKAVQEALFDILQRKARLMSEGDWQMGAMVQTPRCGKGWIGSKGSILRNTVYFTVWYRVPDGWSNTRLPASEALPIGLIDYTWKPPCIRLMQKDQREKEVVKRDETARGYCETAASVSVGLSGATGKR